MIHINQYEIIAKNFLSFLMLYFQKIKQKI